MNTELELRKRLNQPDRNFLETLEFSIKVWNSIEFVLLTKQEIIIDEFCNNLSKLRKEIKEKKDVEYKETAWKKINEFLDLRYSSGAVSIPVKSKLVKTITEDVNLQAKENEISWLTLKALLITLQNTSIQSFYKSSLKEFARFVATTIKYFQFLIRESIEQELKNEKADEITKVTEEILTVLRTYIKQTSELNNFINIFAREILSTLCELVILLKNNDIDHSNSLRTILQELFFDGSKTDKLKSFFAQGCLTTNQSQGKLQEYRQIFDVPIHIFLLVAETVLVSFRNDVELQKNFFHYLFNDENGKWSLTAGSGTSALNSFTYFINLLKIHDTPINFQMDNQKAFTYLGQKIERFVDSYTEQHPQEIMNLVCAAIKLNPLILEHSACPIAVKFMLIAKSGETFWQKYDELMFLLIEMFRKLSRPEKLISQLIRNVYEALTTIKLSKKLKRSFPDEQNTPKRMKISEQNTSVSAQPVKTTLDYVALLENNLLKQTDPVKIVNTSFNEAAFLWPDIAFAFPPTVSYCFTKFISTLLSKPSLVIWKTLIFTLKDYLQLLVQADTKVSENTVFSIEFTSALLSQYFIGSRLAEQSDKMWKAIEDNRKFTYETLSDFGHAILNQEHNYRIMNAFLRLSYNASNFDLLCWYYCPDSIAQASASDEGTSSENSGTLKLNVEKNIQNLHSFVTPKEWTIIEQRITNFGKRECKANINKLFLQRIKAKHLLTNVTPRNYAVDDIQRDDLKKYLLSQTLSDIEQVKEILIDETFAAWFIKNLNTKQKDSLCQLLLAEPTFFKSIKIIDQEFINNLVVSAGKRCVDFFEFEKSAKILQSFNLESTSASSRYWDLLINECTNKRITAPKDTITENRQNIVEYFGLINHLPIGFCSKEVKTMCFLLNIAVFCGLKKLNDAELKAVCLKILKKLLYFGEFPALSTHFSIEALLKIFANEPEANQLYEIIFDRVIRDFTETDVKLLDDFILHLEQFENKSDKEKEEILHVSVLIVVNLSKNKKHKDYYEKYRVKVFELIKNELNAKDENVQEFVIRMLPAVVMIARSALAKEEIDEDVKKVFKVFIENSINCKNQNSIKLMNMAVNHKRVLELTENDLKTLVDGFWEDFKDCCNKGLIDDTTEKLTETILKIIIDFKSTEEWIELLKEIDEDARNNIFTEKSKQQFRIISNIGKCQLNKAKGQIFSEFVKRISFWINLKLISKELPIENDLETWLQLLECHTVIINNNQIPVTFELIDDILQLLTEINIKKINVQTFGSERFVVIFDKMISLCAALINHRHVFIMDRIPQFVNVFKDLLETCCWYKSDRDKQISLSQAEVTMLAEMAHKLEKMNKSFVKHAEDVKRIAPYLLVFIINLMISNDRPTTLYPKIKTHIEYICYDLIAVCDHRTNSFILRSCSEAAKSIYESLHKEYEKYFKFKGKV